jgi:carbon-monoxide dehydrogenase small subunit
MHEWPVKVSVNGRPTEATVEPRLTLADYLRERCGLKGTHLGCEHGACGACTVLVDGHAMRSCLMFAVQTDGSEVTTVEGIASEDGALPRAGRFARVSWPAMWVLHAGVRHVDHRAAAGQPEAHP